MAGIGFELRRLMADDTFIGDIRAYLYAGIISAGPWIISVLCLAFLWMFSYPALTIGPQKVFRVIVVYTFAFSLITTGWIQLVVTRFLADRLYLKQKNILLPDYVGLMLVTVLFQGASAVVFYAFTDLSLGLKITGVMLYVAVSCIWQTMIFLSASRDYLAIVWSFFIGALASFFGALMFGKYFGLEGHVFGFSAGQILIAFLLMFRVFYEFDSPLSCRFDFFRQIHRYFDLLLMGVFYFTAIWIDKIVYWFSASGDRIAPLFYSHYPYDSCMFIAFLTIIPALAHFLVDVETNFYEMYKGFYGAIMNKGSYQTIMAKKKEMVQTLYDSGSRMFVLQTAVTTLFLFGAPHFIQFLSLKPEHLWTVRAAGLGTYFHSFLLVTLIIILYFNRRKEALAVAVFFFFSNALATYAVIRWKPEWMGLGYAASAFLSAGFALIVLACNVRDIEYLTFTEQPIVKPSLPKETPESPAASKALS
ncbi:MAG: exopolysaccharide Pel transporter PelG [Candidatus Omnitrophota bacterium]